MSTEQFSGPIDFVVFTVPRGTDVEPTMNEILTRVDAGIIEILDVEVITAGADGSAQRISLADAGSYVTGNLTSFDGVESQILEPEDLEHIAQSLAADEVAIAVIYEDRSLASAANLVTAAGGSVLWTGGITLDDLEHALEIAPNGDNS